MQLGPDFLISKLNNKEQTLKEVLVLAVLLTNGLHLWLVLNIRFLNIKKKIRIVKENKGILIITIHNSSTR